MGWNAILTRLNSRPEAPETATVVFPANDRVPDEISRGMGEAAQGALAAR